MTLALQIIHHPLNTLADFIASDMEYAMALAEEEQNEAFRTKGTKRVLVLGSSLRSSIGARVLTNPSPA